jgi:cellulose synthase operon protein C
LTDEDATLKTRINWKLCIVLVLAAVSIGATGVLLRQYHRNKRAADGYANGMEAYRQGQWRQAAVHLGRYIAIHPQDTEVLLKYAQSNARIEPARRESLTQAVNAYRAILRLEDHEQAAAELCQIYLDAQMPAEAELVAKEFAGRSSDNRFWQYLAESLTGQRKYDQAVTVLMQLINLQPDHILAFDLLGKIAEQQPGASRFSAQEWFDQAVEKNPQDASAYVLRSAYWARQGQIDQSVQDLERAEQCPLTDVGDRISLAAGWMQQGRLEAAKRHLEQARQMDPGNVQLWKSWAMWAQFSGDPAQMLSVAEAALEHIGWDNYAFLPIAGELFVKGGQPGKAERCLEVLKAAEADRGLILYMEGLIADARMDWAKAIDRWRQAIHLGYRAEPVYLNLAQTLDHIQNRAAAISLLRRYVSSVQGAFRGHLLLGHLFVQDSRYAEAMAEATAAVQLKPSSLDAQVFYLHCRIVSLRQTPNTDWSVLESRIRALIEAHDVVRTRLLLFEAALKKRDYASAAEVIRTGREDLGDNVEWILAEAELLKTQHQDERLTKLLEQSVGRFADSLELVRMLAGTYTSAHRYEEASAFLKDTLSRTPKAVDKRRLCLWMAEVEFLGGNPDKASAIYLKLADANLSDVYARRQLLALQNGSADAASVRGWIEEIRRVEGEGGWQWKYELARLLYQQDPFESRYPQIVELLEQNLVDNPDDLDSRVLLASTYARANNLQLALSLYRQALAIRPDDVELIVAAVGLMYRAEEYRSAQQLLERAMHQGLQDARLTRFELQNSLRMGRIDTAVSSLERLIVESPGDKDAKLTLGLLLIRQGDFRQAQSVIAELKSEDPDSVEAAAAMADLHLASGKAEEALAVCDSYLAQHDTVAARTLRAQVLIQANRPLEALEEIERIRYLASTVSEKLAIVELYRGAGDIQRANEAIGALLRQLPEDPSVVKQAVFVYLEQADKHAEGRRLIEKALQLNPRDQQLRLQKAQLLILRKTADALSEAMKILTEMVYETPRFETGWVLLGEGAILQRDSGLAINIITRGLANLPDSRRLLLLKARAEAMRSPLLAIRTLEELQEQTPEDVEVLGMLSEMYRRSNQPARAVALLNEALKKPHVASAESLQKEWIAAAYQAGQKSEAFAYVQRKTELTGGSESFLSAWTGLLVRDGRWKEAVEVYRRWALEYPARREVILPVFLDQLTEAGSPEAVDAGIGLVQDLLRENPNNLTAIYSMAMLLHHSGKRLQAVPWYEKTIRLNPGQVIAVNNLAWILATEKGELAQALKLAEEGVRQAPTYVDLIDTRGYVLMRMGQYEQAVAEFEKCLRMYIEKSPKRTSSMFHLGRCLMELNKPDQAQIELLRTRRLQQENGGLTVEQQQQLEELIQRLSRMEATGTQLTLLPRPSEA